MTLAAARMPELVDALANAATEGKAGPSGIPPRAIQLADFVLAEAIRLIRLGKRAEVAAAAAALSRMMISPQGDALKNRHPSAYETLTAASIALSASVSPASKGGELTVLRSWNGKAREALRLVAGAEGQSMQRMELRQRLDVEESYLSHLLADMEAAGLVERIRDGRTVTVHLGPSGRTEHVDELIGDGAGALIRAAIERIIDAGGLLVGTFARLDADGLSEFAQELVRLRQRVDDYEIRVTDTIVEGDVVVVRLQLEATLDRGEKLTRHPMGLARLVGGRIVELEWSPPVGEWLPEPRRIRIEGLGLKPPRTVEMPPTGGLEPLDWVSTISSPDYSYIMLDSDRESVPMPTFRRTQPLLRLAGEKPDKMEMLREQRSAPDVDEEIKTIGSLRLTGS